MSKKSKAIAEEVEKMDELSIDEPENPADSDEAKPESAVKQPEIKEKRPVYNGQPTIVVMLKNGLMREYSLREHGVNYQILAKQYAENKDGKVIVRG